MNRDILQKTVFEVIATIAPEFESGAIKPARPLRDQLDLDSVDWLNFLVALHSRLGVEISETQASKLRTMDDLLGFLETQLNAPG
jgi:acyl carrier protein